MMPPSESRSAGLSPFLRGVCIGLAALTLSGYTRAAESAENAENAPPSVEGTPAPVTGRPQAATPKAVAAPPWQIQAGYLFDLKETDGKNIGYYRVEYEGRPVVGSGEPFSLSNPAAAPDLNPKEGGPEDLKFRLERGTAELSGGILDTVVRRPLFSIGGLESFRGVFGINTTTDFDSITFSGGLESPVFNPLRFLNSSQGGGLNVVNWMFFSVLAESQNREDAGGEDQDVGVAAYRAFVGRGWSPTATRASIAFDETVKEHIRKLSETQDPGETTRRYDYEFFQKSIREIPSATRDTVEENLYFLATLDSLQDYLKGLNTTQWEKFAFAQVGIGLEPVKNFNRVQAWADTSGWYQFTGEVPNRRFSSLSSANLRFYIGRGVNAPDNWIGLRYENGRERSTPDVYKNFFTVTTGFRF